MGEIRRYFNSAKVRKTTAVITKRKATVYSSKTIPSRLKPLKYKCPGRPKTSNPTIVAEITNNNKIAAEPKKLFAGPKNFWALFISKTTTAIYTDAPSEFSKAMINNFEFFIWSGMVDNVRTYWQSTTKLLYIPSLTSILIFLFKNFVCSSKHFIHGFLTSLGYSISCFSALLSDSFSCFS